MIADDLESLQYPDNRFLLGFGTLLIAESGFLVLFMGGAAVGRGGPSDEEARRSLSRWLHGNLLLSTVSGGGLRGYKRTDRCV